MLFCVWQKVQDPDYFSKKWPEVSKKDFGGQRRTWQASSGFPRELFLALLHVVWDWWLYGTAEASKESVMGAQVKAIDLCCRKGQSLAPSLLDPFKN